MIFREEFYHGSMTLPSSLAVYYILLALQSPTDLKQAGNEGNDHKIIMYMLTDSLTSSNYL